MFAGLLLLVCDHVQFHFSNSVHSTLSSMLLQFDLVSVNRFQFEEKMFDKKKMTIRSGKMKSNEQQMALFERNTETDEIVHFNYE